MPFSIESHANHSEEEPREIIALKMRIKHAQEVIDGKLLSGDTVYSDLIEAIKAAEIANVNIDAFKSTIDTQLEEIPSATIKNYMDEVEKFIGKGDMTHAKMWQETLDDKFTYWKEKGLFGSKGISELYKQSKELGTQIQAVIVKTNA